MDLIDKVCYEHGFRSIQKGKQRYVIRKEY